MSLDAIRSAVDQVRPLYHQLVLVVGPPASGKTALLQLLSQDSGWPFKNINFCVSEALLPLGEKARATALNAVMQEVVDKSETPILLDNLEMLFDPRLRQDPLRLLEGLSRNRVIVASWGGHVENGKLIYVAIDHPEYRAYDTADLVIVDVSGS